MERYIGMDVRRADHTSSFTGNRETNGRPFRWLRGRSPLSASLPGISDTSDETGLLH